MRTMHDQTIRRDPSWVMNVQAFFGARRPFGPADEVRKGQGQVAPLRLDMTPTRERNRKRGETYRQQAGAYFHLVGW